MNQQLVIGVIIGLVLGGAGGYFYATSQTTPAAPAPQAQGSGAPSVNAVGNVQTNPYDVKTNPFE